MNALTHLIYASSATHLMSPTELFELLQKSRDKNRRAGLTGMLLYRGGNFLQVLEGEAQAVEAIYRIIEQDPRHRQVTHILRQTVSQRIFHEWEMGFTNLDTTDVKHFPGYTDFLSSPFTPDVFAVNPSRAYIFLESFKAFR